MTTDSDLLSTLRGETQRAAALLNGISERIAALEEQLNEMDTAAEAWVAFMAGGPMSLGWAKANGAWRLWVREELPMGSEAIKALVDCNRHVRFEASKHLTHLLEVLIHTARDFADRLEGKGVTDGD